MAIPVVSIILGAWPLSKSGNYKLLCCFATKTKDIKGIRSECYNVLVHLPLPPYYHFVCFRFSVLSPHLFVQEL